MSDTCAVSISVIIPTLNEAEHIGALLQHLQASGPEVEYIVVDASSPDGTAQLAKEHGVQVITSPEASRAKQLNLGAEHASGEVLYFVHADTRPPATWHADVTAAVEQGQRIGGYRFQFDSKRPLLKLNSWFTRFNVLTFRGGDQSLFLTRALWEELQGFQPHMCIMEEYDLIERAGKSGAGFHLMKGATRVSARKYEQNGYMQVQWANLVAMRGYKRGVPPEEIRRKYYRMLRHPKA